MLGVSWNRRAEKGVVMQKYKDALNEIDATPLQRKMAAILMAINGEESAMEFVEMVRRQKKIKESR